MAIRTSAPSGAVRRPALDIPPADPEDDDEWDDDELEDWDDDEDDWDDEDDEAWSADDDEGWDDDEAEDAACPATDRPSVAPVAACRRPGRRRAAR
ncbi:MAG: hypothetical protein U0470_00485 [Anaerolineae bacterium]